MTALKPLALAFIFNLFSGMIAAQCSSFKVYYVSGQAILTVHEKKSRVVRNTLLNAGYISLSKNSQVILYTDKNRVVVLSKPGTYTLQQLQIQCTKNETTFVERYLEYLHEELKKEAHAGGQWVHASVERGEKIQIAFPPDSSSVLSGLTTFTWFRSYNCKSCYFTLLDSKYRVITMDTINNDTAHTRRISLPSPLPESLFWCIDDMPDYPEKFKLHPFTVVDSTETTMQTEGLIKEMKTAGITGEMQAVTLTGFFLKAGLVTSAYQNTLEGIRQFPDSIPLKEIMVLFKKKINPVSR
jgi:hypothetical protein